MKITKRISIALAFAAALSAAQGALAQAPFPSKPITWVVGFPPGGGADGVARIVTAKMSQNIGQTIVVENRPGASSMIAAQYVAQAPADGYTVFGAENGALVYNAALYSKLNYDPAKDFAPVTNIITAPLLLVVHPSFPASDFKTFIDVVKKQPGKLNYASPGKGIAHYLAMEMLKARAGLDIVDVSFKGIGPVVQDMLAGQMQIAVIDTVVVLPHVRSGKLRALASFTSRRLAVTPDVPSMAELGYPDLDFAPIVGLVAPAKTPPDVVAKLNAEAVRAIRDPEVSKKLMDLGLEIIANTPQQFSAYLDAEAKRMLPFIRSLNIKLD
jgi:tripartite-type tricarboxylate transporter receptor subunit TctC